MHGRRTPILGILMVLSLGVVAGRAQNLKITLPRRSALTPVQRLNREGVDAVRRQQYENAETLFYKAYLYDPSDPFTLNNLGYIAELQGQLDRAQRFYKLAAEQGTNAFVDESNEKELEGKRMSYALDSLKDLPMRINRMNFDAMTLLSQNRGAEAVNLLQAARRLQPNNAFTLNNLGVANDAVGDDDEALRFYNASAATRSGEPVVVTMTGAERGRPVSQVAANNAQRLEQRMQDLHTNQAQSALLASRGVAAINRNDWSTARQDFLQAYRLNPYSAFSLNNAGYVAEREGDVETAEFFYAKAQQADDAHAQVGTATHHGAEGNPMGTIATNNDQETEAKLDAEREARRRQTGPIQLLHRDGTPVVPTKPAQPAPPNGSAPVPQQPQP
jgi:Flp pilus assembly protein TadD